MDNNRKNQYAYLSYVTLHEMWEEAKSYFWAWAIVSGVSLVIGILGTYGISLTKDVLGQENSSVLPSWVWFVIVFSAITWFLKGEEIKFSFPNLTFKSWLILTLLFTLIIFVFTSFPWWVGLPFYWGIVMAALSFDTLAAKGKENYLKLTNNSNESA